MARRRESKRRVMSMTGHGRGEARGKAGHVEIEVSSVNRRQLDVRVNIPRQMAVLEPMIHELVGDKVSRGSVNVVVRYASSSAGGELTVDERLARKYVRELRKTGKKLNLKDDLTMKSVLTLPDVIRMAEPEKGAGLRSVVKKALAQALSGMLTMREREGRALANDIQKRFNNLSGKVKFIKSRSVNVSKRYRASLLKRMKKMGMDFKSTNPQVIKEVALFADKADITEELVRLDSHLSQVKEIFKKTASIGRTLDFLCQEIFREINTVGSKANDREISRIVVDFKAELEAIREQVQNVE